MSQTTSLIGRARWILSAWGRHKGWVTVLFFFTLVSAGVTMAYPLVLGRVVEELRHALETRADVDATVVRVGALLLAIGVGRWVAAMYPGTRALVNSKIDLDLRERAFARLLVKGHRFFGKFRTGDLVTRLTDDIASYPKIAWFCCSGLFRALDSGTRVVACLGLMLWLEWSLALAALAPVPFMIACFLLLHRRLGKATAAQRAAASETSDHLEAAFTGVTIVQAHAAEARLGDALRRQLERRADAEVALARLWVLLSIFFQALNVVGQLVVVVLGGLRVIDGTLPVGDFFAFYLYLGLLLGPMMDLPNLFVTGRQAFVCMDRLDEVEAFDREGEGGACRGAVKVDAVTALGLERVSAGYTVDAPADAEGEAKAKATPPKPEAPKVPAPQARRSALREVSLRLERGERVALVGPIGGGKTTVARLLVGALAPSGESGLEAGRVVAETGDGRTLSLADLDAGSFRRSVGFVPQDPVLFTASLRENVVFGRPLDPERLAWAIDLAGMTAEVAALPKGLDHEVGLRGKGLSGGQRQRITIARALYGEPKVLILDDITAALDAENEERFWRRLLERWPDLTALVVTHRAATARRMDRVVMLDEGRVVAQGAHTALLDGSPAYRALWRLEARSPIAT
jgi:ABC-type multidrug transport system fused ATPase/permease subunit